MPTMPTPAPRYASPARAPGRLQCRAVRSDATNVTLVSVVIPMRNAERFVAETLRSVLAQAGQGNAFELEVVVVDDGSTDGSADVVRGLTDSRVRMIPGPQRGISASFNAGLAAA